MMNFSSPGLATSLSREGHIQFNRSKTTPLLIQCIYQESAQLVISIILLQPKILIKAEKNWNEHTKIGH